jgi:stage IV sporulation protein B
MKNTTQGIYGIYNAEFPDKEALEVAQPDEIKLGKATIYTVLKGEDVNEYEINITKINKNTDVKNISFTITDKELLKKTGGVIQGMSGSPIIQNNKIIGTVTHVIVDNPESGYGIFITSMLEEGEK